MDPQRVLIDTERVIEEVRARPQIWQPRHPHYKSREARQLAWAEVARELVPRLQDLASSQQLEIEKKIQQRWRTARDSFVKARAQLLEGGGGARERNYGYYDAMTFLEPTLRPPLKVQLAHAPPPLPTRRRRFYAPRPSRHTPLDEDDDHFFASLAPMLRTLRTEQKLWFRSRVLALALQLQPNASTRVEQDSRDEAERGEEDEFEEKYRPPSPVDDGALGA